MAIRVNLEVIKQWVKDPQHHIFIHKQDKIVNLLKLRDKIGNSLLHYAVNIDSAIITTFLIKLGCDVNSRNYRGQSPLGLALDRYSESNDNTEIMRILVNNGAVCNNYFFPNGNGPLHRPYLGINLDMVNMFLNAGCDVNARNFFGLSPLFKHIYTYIFFITLFKDNLSISRAQEVVKRLIEAGANDREWYAGVIPLHLIIAIDDLAMTEILLKARSTTDWSNDTEVDLLHLAAQLTSIDMMKLLLKYGLSVKNVNEDGFDPLSNALYQWVQKEYSLPKRPEPLSQLKCLKFLLKNGADINKMNKDGLTPLHVALQFDGCKIHNDIVYFLLKNGAVLDFDNTAVQKVFRSYRGYKLRFPLLKYTAMCNKIPVDERNRPLNFHLEDFDKGTQEDYNSCERELENMRVTNIYYGSVSYLKLFEKKNIGSYLKNKKIVDILSDDRDKILIMFPIYGKEMLERCFKEQKKQAAIQEACKHLSYVLKLDMDSHYLILNNIARCLTKKDFQTLALV